jgi:hypothetical protein
LESGVRAIVPGEPGESAILDRIETDDADFMMPPADSGKSLSAEEKVLIRRWIESGAEYEPHWAFVAPQRPVVPNVLHEVQVQNPIDAFVFAKLQHEGLRPAPVASGERHIRRLYFDLIGLPPTLREIDDYLVDDSPQAYQKVVDRLLESPQYGERMAADWLDGAHYADSNGYQNDFARNMWPWRDWVIAAFNDHMPYDQFVVEQLAGDLLPAPSRSQCVATGFCRNNRTVTEAGSIEAEWLVENVVDRTETVGTMLLGLTVGCARCHDHKFDPISQREFYQLFAFFNNVAEKGVYTEVRGNVAPLIRVASPEQTRRLAEYDSKIKSLEAQFARELDELAPLRKRWIEHLAEAVESVEPTAAVGIDLRDNADARVAVLGKTVTKASASAAPEWREGLFGQAVFFSGKDPLEYPQVDFPPADRPFSWAVWLKPEKDGAVLSKMDDDSASRGCDLFLYEDGTIGIHLIHSWPTDGIKALTKSPLGRDKWSHVAVTYDGTRKAEGVKVYFDGRPQEVVAELDNLTGTLLNDEPFRVGRRSKSFPLRAGVRDVRLFQHALTGKEVAAVLRGSLHRTLKFTDYDRLDKAARGQFDDLLLEHWSNPAVTVAAETRRQLITARHERQTLDDAIPTTMVMEELQDSRLTYLLERGQYDQPDKSEPLTPDVPAALPPLPIDAPRNRLGLARWIVNRDNPLAARVAVNRIWQQFFGTGLVKTSENFGIQSEPPSHPEMLDWLAVELMESNWDLQHIQRLIVTSYVYQQSADVGPELYELDPENRLLARGPRYRLSAEGIRDHVLAVSGLMTPKVGGPSVMPYQPEGLWEELAGGAFEVYTQGHGDDLYRRSLYMYRKRTVPHPSMSTFDAPSWEICQVKRARTNTPLQALALLNDVVYVEAARKLAERALIEGGATPKDRLTFAFRLATSRKPTRKELSTLTTGVQRYLAQYRGAPESAEQLLAHGESPRAKQLEPAVLASYTAVVSVILNMDESISKN